MDMASNAIGCIYSNKDKILKQITTSLYGDGSQFSLYL